MVESSVLPKNNGMMGGHGLGVACGHTSFLSHIKEKSGLEACRTNMPKYAGENNTGNKALQSMSRSRCIGTIVFMV